MYQPNQEILDKYADVLVKFALNGGRGVKKGDVVFLQVPESAKPLLISLQRSVLKSGANPVIQYLPNEMLREFYQLASLDQLKFFPAYLLKGRIKQVNHFLAVFAETDYHELEGIDSHLIMERNLAFKPYYDWRNKKEIQGKLSWSLCLYPTPAMAKEAGLTLRQAWHQVIKACFLNYADPIKKWQRTQKRLKQIRHRLDRLQIATINIKSRRINLNLTIGDKRRWLGGGGANIPSFEIFTSPDWRGTNGYIFLNQPLYRSGNLIKNIRLVFKNGRVVEAKSDSGQDFLTELVKIKNGDKIGEFSLTDRRFSKINRFMAETLYDENFGGQFGNTHIALGASYKDTYSGDAASLSNANWEQLGYNECVSHTDVISTEDRVVTATLKNGQKIILYKSGQFQI